VKISDTDVRAAIDLDLRDMGRTLTTSAPCCYDMKPCSRV
jgi:hypothetical protein